MKTKNDVTSRAGTGQAYMLNGSAVLKYIDPDTGAFDNDLVTSETKPTIWFEGSGIESGQWVQFRVGRSGEWVDAVFDPAKGLWRYDVDGVEVVLSEGDNSITTRVTDGTHFSDAATSLDSIVIVSQTTSQGFIDSYTDDIGAQVGDFDRTHPETDDRILTLNGHVDQEFIDDNFGAVGRHYLNLALYIDGVRYDSIAVQSDGTWSYNLPQFEQGQTPSFSVVVEDVAGNTGNFSNPFDIDIQLGIGVTSDTTFDTTPTLNGTISFELLPEEHVEIIIKDKASGLTKVYSSANGQVIVDQAAGTWSLKIPAQDALTKGDYEVTAALHKNGTHDVVVEANGTLVVDAKDIPPIDGGGASSADKATALTLGEDGQWKVFSNGMILDQKANDDNSFNKFGTTALRAKDMFGTQNGTWVDFNRDGLMDFIANDGNGSTGQQVYINLGNNRYLNYQMGSQYTNGPDYNPKANVASEFGGVIGFDRTGHGYSDFMFGGIRPGSSGSVQARAGYRGLENTWDSQIVVNVNGTLQALVKDSNFTNGRYGPNIKTPSSNWGNAQAGQEVSGVDLDNDGKIDLVFHGVNGSNKLGSGRPNLPFTSDDQYRLVVVGTDGRGNYDTTQIVNGVFQNNSSATAKVGNGVSMTWADFNGDGYMDLFLGRGHAESGHSEYESRILFNDGRGHLASTTANGVGVATNVHWMGDSLQGGASIAVDWNGDGKMDIIELPGIGSGNGMTEAGNTGAINLYTNTSANGVINFDTSNLLGGNATIGLNGTVNAHLNPAGKKDPVTGAVAVDLNWDGAKDLMVFTQQGNTQVITNHTNIADGTSLHLRILDQEGINSLLGNTVQLYDSRGNFVASQIINPQSGNQTSETTSIVDFYGLDPNETYSAVLLRNVDGRSANVGGLDQPGTNWIDHFNAAWGDLKAGAANEAHVLTAESDTNVMNAIRGKGIIGTGYNDTFYATKGTDMYDGAGGTTVVNGKSEWSATGGVDIIDFKLAGNRSVVVDLNKTAYQNTGYDTVKLVNIEGVSGANGNDTFTGNAQDNVFNGRGGNDTFNLGRGGQDTLVYDMIDKNDGTGGNGHDVVNGFTIGDATTNHNADLIDLSGLLGDSQQSGNIGDYVSSVTSGGNTILFVDIDGAGGAFSPTAFLTLNNVATDVDTLIQNHQIIV